MRAYAVEHPEGAFRQIDLPTPALAEGQVLVRINASGVNPLDIKIRAGKAPHAKQPLPAVLGLDMAGVVEAVGPGGDRFSRWRRSVWHGGRRWRAAGYVGRSRGGQRGSDRSETDVAFDA